MKLNNLKVFGLGVSKNYTDQICKHLGISRTIHSEEYQDDGEPYLLSKENVRGADVFVVSSLYNCDKERLSDKVVNLLFFARSLRDASAERITLVMPYMAYQRQDRKTAPRAPVYTKYLPEQVEGLLGKDTVRVLTMDVHNLSAFQSGWRCCVDHLEAKTLVANWISNNFYDLDLENFVICSPDEGGVKRTVFYRDKLSQVLGVELGLAAIWKNRNKKDLKTYGVMGDVRGKQVALFDDMIATGGTLIAGTEAIEAAGGKVKFVVATHGLFVANANENVAKLMSKGIKVVITDTVEPFRLAPEIRKRLVVIPTHEMFAEAIKCIHNSESISKLLV